MNSNRHRCTSSCADCRDAVTKRALENIKPTYLRKVLCEGFFKCFCETTCGTGGKRLNMRSSLVQRQLGRNLQDIDIPALLAFLTKHREITRLNLAGNDITDYGFINLLDHVRRNKNIDELDVENNNILEHGTRYMLHAGKQLELRSLNLKANKLQKDACQNVAMFLLENEHMQSLNVAEVDQTASSLIYFMMVLSPDQETSNETLKTLDIGRPNPGSMYFFDSAHFADVIGHMLSVNATLIALHLQKYGFGCYDIESMMSNAASNKSLHLLDLGCNNIGDHGVDRISEWLIKRPALKVLVLSRNIITDHGARSLSRAAPFSKLLSLDVSYNKITDDGMADVMYSLKKSPMLRQLRIFGNRIGHPIAKIVKRMLLSGVLSQENIDVRPYRVDHRWYFARYEGERCRKEYDDVSYGVSLKPPKKSPPIRSGLKKYFKYTYSASTEFAFKHSIMTLISRALSREHAKDCRCCYCFKCEAPHYDENCRQVDHSDTCACCKCTGGESSDWSVDESVLKRVVSPRDPIKNIEYILRRVNSDTKDKIVRWINMDKEVLEEDLDVIAGPTATEEASESTASCTCSWMQLNISQVQRYLEQSSSKNLLVIPEDYDTCCKDSASSSSSSRTVSLCSTHMK